MSLLDTASLIVTPNGYKEGKLYSVIPSDGSGDMSVGRATTATRVNSAGLVELVPYNLAQYSEDFSNPFWSLYQASILSNDIASPNGTMTATKLIASTNSVAAIYSTGPYNEGLKTFSVYAKAGSQNIVFIDAIAIGGSSALMRVNLSTGALISNTFQNTNIENVGDGWYRISGTYTQLGGSLAQVSFGFGTSVSTNDYAYFWGYQIVEADTALPYLKTETRLNIPRLDYSNGTCPSLLVEPQRTNLVTYSSSFDNGAWDKDGVSIVANNITSASGVQDADKITENSANGIHGLYNLNPYTSITTATASIFFKKGTRKFFSIKLQIGANSYTQVYDSESVTTASNTSNGLTSVSTSVVDFGNGWVRATLTGTNPSGAADAYTVYCLSNSGTPTFDAVNKNPTYQGTGTDYGYIWGAQVENASYQTSYIPTQAATVTRNADVISKTGIADLIGQTEGTVFVELDIINGAESLGIWMRTGVTPYNDMITILVSQFGTCIAEVRASNVNQFVNSSFSIGSGKHKFALAYKANDFAFYIDGTQIATSSSGTPPTCDQVYLGGYPDGGARLSKNIATALYKTRLTNDELATLTTI